MACNGGGGVSNSIQPVQVGPLIGSDCIYVDPSAIKMRGKVVATDGGVTTVCMPNDPAEIVR